MSSVLADLSLESWALANEANFNEFTLARRAWEKTTVFDEPEMLMTLTDIPAPFFNGVRRVNFPPGKVDICVEKVVNDFKERNVPGNFYIGPSTRPADIQKALLAHGFAHMGTIPGMGMDLEALKGFSLPPGFAIEPVRTKDQVRAFVEVGIQGFGMPAFLNDILTDFFISLEIGPESSTQNYLGVLDGKPVAISSIFYGAGVAGIYNVTTLAEARGKGIGAAITVGPLLDARAKGYRIGVLQTTEMGYSVYEKIGFQEVCKLEVYTWKPE